MGLDESNIAKVSTEPVPVLKNIIPEIHAQSKAIIYSFISVEANYRMKAAQYRQENPPHGISMLEYFVAPYSVYLSREFLSMVVKNLKLAILASQGEAPDILNQVNLFALLHLFNASLLSIKCCRMTV